MSKVRSVRAVTLTYRAKRLRRACTDAEARLWEALRDRRLGGWKWRRQAPCGPFILDFLCAQARLVVELDGSQHAEQQVYDARRTAQLAAMGLRVLRFWNSEVLANLDGVCVSILEALDEASRQGRCRAAPAVRGPAIEPPSPYPLPQAGEE
jgi:very-short-patch-repair endonuclease